MIEHTWLRRAVVSLVSLGIVFSFAAVSLAQDGPELPPATESGMAPVNDIEMYYATYGDPTNPALVLLHGGLGNADYFVNQIPAFSEQYYVITADSRGHGRSTMSEQQIGYALMASDVLALMDTLNIESASLVGWSDGGIIGLDIAINHPERLQKLVAYGANYNPSGVLPTVETDERFGGYIEMAAGDYFRLSPTPDGFDAFVENISNMWATEPNYSVEQMQGITVPTLILDGLQEEAIDPAHNLEMALLIPGADLVLMGGVGHFAMWEKTDDFNDVILYFLAN